MNLVWRIEYLLQSRNIMLPQSPIQSERSLIQLYPISILLLILGHSKSCNIVTYSGIRTWMTIKFWNWASHLFYNLPIKLVQRSVCWRINKRVIGHFQVPKSNCTLLLECLVTWTNKFLVCCQTLYKMYLCQLVPWDSWYNSINSMVCASGSFIAYVNRLHFLQRKFIWVILVNKLM